MLRTLGSVRARTTLAATLMTAIVLVIGSIAIVGLVERSLVDAARESLENAFGAVEDLTDDDAGSRRYALLDDDDDGLILTWTEPHEGALPATLTGYLVESGEDTPVAQVLLDRDDLVVLELSDGFGLKIGAGELPLRVGERIDQGSVIDDDAVQLLSNASLHEVKESIDAVVAALMIIVPLLTLVLGVAIWFTVGRALRPVHAISAQVGRISAQTLHERVPVPPVQDEIAELATTMNHMLDRLEAGSERQRRFVADASHELRSPLSTIKAAAEVAQASEDPSRFGELADDVAAEAQRMDELITDLLDLARLDEQRRGAVADVRLEQLCRAATERLPASAIDVQLNAEDVTVEGVQEQLERAVFNLVLNATQHARSTVAVEVRVATDAATVAVEDDGPGIETQDRERVFERFERLDASRQRGTGGAGIGLSLVRAIADRHGGTVHVEASTRLGGARFVLRLSRQPGRVE